MLFITQLIYIIKGQESIFHEFEEIAIPTIAKYNGKLLLRLRPTAESCIESSMERPYEVHLVEFETMQDFEDFKLDENRKKFLHLKEQSIKASILIQGSKL
ncbi:DUF1330 domain-containing protein [Algoriphagus chordae]|uniref:DUF1330 domain-containing protein n=1 Tax=Algoriphagus chordae TaxID=237019 RepID=A0A2W7QTE4_9BACT|nr:DUF1330 domain-containing protein [Algoriphagus chordae]PZX46987.1 hypothetical protein LV85_04084 [Algoriphagus chordae]